jgi:AraC family transcriptional regulator
MRSPHGIVEPVLIHLAAALAAATPDRVTKAFKAATGVTPCHWLQQYRVEMAMQLLGTTSLPIAEIAIECGFADQSHFTRVFTQLAGSSPGNWRKQGTRRRDRGRL